MPAINLLKQNKKILFAVIFCAVVFGSFFILINPNQAIAQTTSCTDANLGQTCKSKTGPETGTCQSYVNTSGKTIIRCANGPIDPSTGLTADELAKVQSSINTLSNPWLNTLNAAKAILFGKPFDILSIALAKILAFISSAIFTILGWLVDLSAQVFDFVVNPGDNSPLTEFTKAPIVQTGWKISRDVANMFFSLILVIIAFATILKIESYGAKNLIKNIVIAALLINFSLVIGGVIIDFSQVLTSYFFNAAGGSTGVTEKIMKSISPDNLYSPPNLGQISERLATIYGQTNEGKDNSSGISQFLKVATNLIFGTILLLLIAFVFFAGAILLIIRLIVLWFLLILAPLAWLAYILPATGSQYHTWWSKFFKQAFFAPAFAFFIYLSISVLANGPIIKSNATTGFNAGFVINYIIVIGLLFGSLLAAQQMGAYGASGAVSLAKKWGKSAGKFVAKEGTGYDKWAPVATSVAGGVMSGLGLRKLGGMVQGKALQMREKELERPGNKSYQRYLNSLAPDQLQREMQSAHGANLLMATQAARDSKILDNADPAVARRAMDTYRSFGKIKEARELEEIRPDALTDPNERNTAIQRAIANGTYKRWGNQVFQGPLGPQLIETLRTQLPVADFINAIRGWSQQVRQGAVAAMQANFTDDFTNPDNINRRRIYAASTNNIGEAFADSSTAINIPAATEHIQRMTPMHIGGVNNNPDLQLIGAHITPGQLASIRGELSAQQKQQLILGATNARNAAALAYIGTSLAWNV